MKRPEFDKHVLFMPHWDDPNKFSYLGPYGWTPLKVEQSSALRELEDEFVPAAAVYDPKDEEDKKRVDEFLAFGIFIVPGITTPGVKRGVG
jgi:hypothetical protein